MKHLATILTLVVPILGAAVGREAEAPATPAPHNLTLVLEGVGQKATMRLLPENVPAHVSLDTMTPLPAGVFCARGRAPRAPLGSLVRPDAQKRGLIQRPQDPGGLDPIQQRGVEQGFN